MKEKIYLISCNGVPLYVGRTQQELNTRLKQHLSAAKKRKNRKDRVLNTLVEEGYKVEIELLKEVDLSTPNSEEDLYISNYEGQGYKLLNGKAGDSDRLVVVENNKKREPLTEDDFTFADWRKNDTGKGNKNEKVAKIKGIEFYRTGWSKLRFYYPLIGFVDVGGFVWNMKVERAIRYFQEGTEENKRLKEMIKKATDKNEKADRWDRMLDMM